MILGPIPTKPLPLRLGFRVAPFGGLECSLYQYDPDPNFIKKRTHAWNSYNPLDMDAMARHEQISLRIMPERLRKDREERAKDAKGLANVYREPGRFLHQTQGSGSTGSNRAASTASLSKLFDKYRGESTIFLFACSVGGYRN